jgi:hypothetical protein
MTEYYQNISTTFSVVTKFGEYFNCEFELSNIRNSTLLTCDINNSKIDLSKSVNSEISRSVFLNSKFNSDKVIKILDYDERYVKLYDDSPSIRDYKLYKFYIDESSYSRLSEFQNFYFDGIEIKNSDLLNLFDEKFTISEYLNSYNYKYINNTLRSTSNIKVYLSSKDENIKTVSEFGIDGSNSLVTNTKTINPSIDVYLRLASSFFKKLSFLNFNVREVQVPSGPYRFDIEPFTNMTSWGSQTASLVEIFTSISSFTFSGATSSLNLYTSLQSLGIGTWTYSGDIFEVTGDFVYRNMIFTDGIDGVVTESVGSQYQVQDVVQEFNNLSFDNAYILDSDFKSGLFKDSTWISGNHMNYTRDHALRTWFDGSEQKYDGDIEGGGPENNLINISTSASIRERLLVGSDVAYLNGFYFDSRVISGENLVKLPKTFKIFQYTDGSSTQQFKMYDFINGTSSSMYNLIDTTSALGGRFFLTPGAENGFNYLHPVKFENSKIKQGIFRMTYFENCLLYNSQFNNLDRDPKDYRNWKSFLITDTLFHDNGNTVKSGIFYNSYWLSGSDTWLNGIFYNSTWNVQSFSYSLSTVGDVQTTSINKFNDGIVKQSRWIDGVFANGQFYKNNSNTVFTASVYNDLVRNNTSAKRVGGSHRTRYSWENGTFESGVFEQSTFEAGTFKTGEFFRSTFLTGNAEGGNFGKRNLKYSETRVASGSFSNVNVLSAEFRAANPNGSVEDNFEIDWNNGIFNNGLFGVYVDSASYSESGINYSFRSTWHDGTWQSGIFTDTARWIKGKFNGGKFTSYFGYPFVTAASYSSATADLFAWEDGEFNDGEFGLGSTGSNSTWYNGEFNGGIFTGRYWNNGIFTRGKFIGSGNTSTLLYNIPNYTSQFSNDFYGLWNSGYVSEIKDKQVTNKKFTQKPEREFTKSKIVYQAEIRNALWRGGVFSHNNGLFNNSVWTDGIFEKGVFANSSFNPYINYLVNGNFQETIDENGISQPTQLVKWQVDYSDQDEDGNVIGGVYTIQNSNEYSGDIKRVFTYLGTSSIATIYQTTGLIIGESYTFRMIVRESYNMEVRFGDSTLSLQNRNFILHDTNWIIGATSQSLGVQPTVIVATGSPGYIDYTDSTADGSLYVIYPDILSVGRNYYVRFYAFNKNNMDDPYIGSCDSSQVTIEDGYILSTAFVDGTNITFSQVGVPSVAGSECLYESVITADYSDLMINFTTLSSNSQLSLNGFIITSNTGLYTSDISQRTAYNYTFTAEGPDFAIELIPLAEASANGAQWNPATVSIAGIELVKGESGFNLSQDCHWENGTFRNSEFYVSQWYNGKWESGNAVGMIWKNGVANYMNAFNIMWEGGVWRNGNWNGAPFGYENITENGCLLSFTESQFDDSPINSLQAIVAGGDWSGKNLFNDSIPPTNAAGEASISITINSPVTSGSFNVNVSDGSGSSTDFAADYRDPALDPDTSDSWVNSYGFPFVRGNPIGHLNNGETYRVTVNIGSLTVAQSVDRENVGIQISLGRPGSAGAYGETSGTYEGSLYPLFRDVVSAEDFVSPYRKIVELDGHSGALVDSGVIPGIDAWIGSGGQMTETLVARDNRTLYLHFNLYGVSSLTIDSIIVERVICELASEINEGYTSDIITNIARYRQSIGDSSYQEIFINNAFTFSTDDNYPDITGSPGVDITTFTQSDSGILTWEFLNNYTYYAVRQSYPVAGAGPKGSVSYISVNNSSSVQTGGPIWRTFSPVNNYLYVVDENLNRDIFTASGEYEITFRYSFGWSDPNELPDETSYPVRFRVEIGYIEVDGEPFDNGGIKEQFDSDVFPLPVASVSGPNALNFYIVTPTGGFYADSTIRTYTTIFNPSVITDTSDSTKWMRFRKMNLGSSGSLVDVRIHGITITRKATLYDTQFNNATYSLLAIEPSYDDVLILPNYSKTAVATNGYVVSTNFGNGLFVSGTGSALSSIWENGVWNNGLRYDKNIVVFTDLSKLSGSSKSDARQAEFEIKGTRVGTVPNTRDDNFSRVKYSTKNWLITLDAAEGYIQFENSLIDQSSLNINYYFKVGDKVSVGNVVAVDINGKRKLLRDYFTVVAITRTTKTDTINPVWQIILSISINFPIRTIERDSVNHPIYVSKNIWLNGAYLNGTFRGIWTNGLFKGRPYLTKMIDSQWIDGRFDGGHFKGKTASNIDNILSDNPEVEVFPSGLIQNFIFKDNNLSKQPRQFSYNSWIDVNYVTTQAVNLGTRNVVSDVAISSSVPFGSGAFLRKQKRNKYSINNYYGQPTKDVLSSISYFRNGNDTNITAYSLGWKFTRYEQLIPNNGEFLQPFDNYAVGITPSDYPGLGNFISQGWTFSQTDNLIDRISPYDGETLYRFSSNTVLRDQLGNPIYTEIDTTGKFLVSLNSFSHSIYPDGFTQDFYDWDFFSQLILFLFQPQIGGIRLENKFAKVEEQRYTILEFKLNFTGATNTTDWISGDPVTYPLSLYPPGPGPSAPATYNLIDPFVFYRPDGNWTVSTDGYTDNTGAFTPYSTEYSWPLNHLDNTEEIKVEYFYNKPEIYFYFNEGYPLYLVSNNYPDWPTDFKYLFDFIRYTEVDMVPFFRYATGSRIAPYPQSPLSAVAPFIDYTNSEFSLIDNVNISEANFSIEDNIVSLVVSSGVSFTKEEFIEQGPNVGPENLLGGLDILNNADTLSSANPGGGIVNQGNQQQTSKGASKGG